MKRRQCTPDVRIALVRNANAPAPSLPSGQATPSRKPVAGGAQRQTSTTVFVYWDVSQSMRDFATVVHHPPGADGEGKPVKAADPLARRTSWSDDLTPIVRALDGSVLLQAHVNTIRHFGIGDSVDPLPDVRKALNPTAYRTALHLAADHFATALTTGEAQAAIIVSDMEIDSPDAASVSAPTVCHGVPLPQTKDAGSLFGRCYEAALAAAGGPGFPRRHLLVHLFRKSTHNRELYVLLLATDQTLGEQISEGIARAIHFERFVIFDSSIVNEQTVSNATATYRSDDSIVPRQGGCAFKCLGDGTLSVAFSIGRPESTRDTWVYPVAQPTSGTTVNVVKKSSGGIPLTEAATTLLACGGEDHREIAITYRWERHTPWSKEGEGREFTEKDNVRDLFDSLTDAITRTADYPQLRVGVTLLK